MIEVGALLVRRIVDEPEFKVAIRRLLPDAQLERLARHAWLEPDHADLRRGIVKLSMHAFLIHAGGLTILVDTCIGQHKDRTAIPAWHMRSEPRFLRELEAAGVSPEQVDLVFCTHLHADHVGWNTRLEDGRWIPTFPRARYVICATELAHWREVQRTSSTPINHGAFADSVLPVVESGQAMVVEPGERLTPELAIVGLPGHTPGHLGLSIKSGADRALLCGDAIHSPIQIVEPQWASAFCTDAVGAVRTRLNLLSRAAEQGMLLLPAHFRGSGAVAVSRGPNGFVPHFRG